MLVQGQDPNPLEIRREAPREAERDVPPLAVDYRNGDPAANMRLRALVFGDKLGWWTFLWPIDADQVPVSELMYLIVLRDGVQPRSIREDHSEALHGEGPVAEWARRHRRWLRRVFRQDPQLARRAEHVRVPAGRVLRLGAEEVLPFVRGVATVHGLAHMIDYREGLT